jgi:hypothetical protein
MRSRLPAIGMKSVWMVAAVSVVAVVLSGCSAANRAVVHEEDMQKVFPWPRSEQSVTIRVKPMTTMAKTCFLFGSFRDVAVTPDTTFYVVDESEKNFAYTPSRSPIRRLAKIKSMEILWPQKEPGAKQQEEGEEKVEKKEPEKKEPGKKEPEKKENREAPQPKS